MKLYIRQLIIFVMTLYGTAPQKSLSTSEFIHFEVVPQIEHSKYAVFQPAWRFLGQELILPLSICNRHVSIFLYPGLKEHPVHGCGRHAVDYFVS